MKTLNRLTCWALGAVFVAHLHDQLFVGGHGGWLFFAGVMSVFYVFVRE